MPILPGPVGRAVRRSARRPAFTLIAIGMLAVGIGANTAIFSVIHAALFEPLPYPDSQDLVRVWENNLSRGYQYFSTSESNYLDFRDRNTAFEGLAAFGGTSLNLADAGGAVRLNALRATHDFFPMLGIQPLIGRSFTSEEDLPGGAGQVALLGHAFWQEHFAGDADVVGEVLTLNGLAYTVVGVLPDGEIFLDGVDLFVPLAPDPEYMRGDHRIAMAGRLKPGVSIEDARTDLGSVADMLGSMYPDSNGGWGVRLEGFREWLISDSLRTSLWVLMAAVGFVLLIVCANLANMLLAQVSGRRREIAVQTAMGAGTWRIVREILFDGLLLSIAGGILGVVLAVWGTDLLRLLGEGRLPRVSMIRVHTPVLLFAIGATLLVGIISTVLPALQATARSTFEALKEGARTATDTRRRGLVRSGLVTLQIATAIILLVGAGLMVRSFAALQAVDPGFAREGRLTVQMTVPQTIFDSQDAFRAFYPDRMERLETIPGVDRAATINALPLAGGSTMMEIQPEEYVAVAGEDQPSANWRMTSPGYFEAIGVPLVRGRALTWSEDLTDSTPVVLSRSLTERMWPEEDPTGRRVLLWADPNRIGVVVGVVADMQERSLDGDPASMVYLPLLGPWPEMPLVLKTSVTPSSVTDEVRAIVAEAHPDIALTDFRTIGEIVDGTLVGARFYMTLLTIFSLVAALLAAAGIYGVTAYVVSRRTAEIGVRMALGAEPRRVVGLFLARGMLLAAIGVTVGLAGAFALSRLLDALLFQISPSDPLTYAAVALFAALVALAACYVPSRRAARVDPVSALRAE